MKENQYILDFLLQNRQNVLFFTTAQTDVIVKAACALANTHGGTILIGVNEKGDVSGVEEQDIPLITMSLSKEISPSLPFISKTMETNGKVVGIVLIWDGANKPYVADGYSYILNHDAVVAASPSEVVALFASKQAVEDGWERMTQGPDPISLLDDEVLVKIKTSLMEKGKANGDTSDENVLKLMGFIRHDELTNAGIVVTTKTPSAFLPQTRIRVSVFSEKDKKPSLVDVRLFDSNMVKAVDNIAEYIYSLYPKKVVIDGMVREEIETVPLTAIREGLLNAVVHRQYESYQSFVAINAYANYLEIVNSGYLMTGITLEELKNTHRSVLRNPDIANAFYQLGYIEMVGSGTLRIISECRRNGCKDPEWSIQDNCVVLTFPDVHHHLSSLEKEHQIDLSNLSYDASVTESLTRIVEYLTHNKRVKLNKLTEITGKSYPTVKRYMQILKEAGIVKYDGNLRSGGWVLI